MWGTMHQHYAVGLRSPSAATAPPTCKASGAGRWVGNQGVAHRAAEARPPSFHPPEAPDRSAHEGQGRRQKRTRQGKRNEGVALRAAPARPPSASSLAAALRVNFPVSCDGGFVPHWAQPCPHYGWRGLDGAPTDLWPAPRGGHTLHYITLHYITLHYITLHYIT